MKTQHIVLTCLFIIASVCSMQAQKGSVVLPKKEIIPVWGECGMCRNKIEKAAKTAGAETASWNEDSKQLSVSYFNNKTNAAKIQQAVAAAGYDTKDICAPQAAYDKLPGCCHYERKKS